MSRVITARTVLVATAVLQMLSSTVRGAVVFQLTFPDVVNDTNQHWDDPTYGAQARATLAAVLNEIGREFAETATIDLNITSSTTTAYAAGANTASYHRDATGGFYDGNTYIKIRTGNDLNGAAPDAAIEYSFNFSLYADNTGDSVVDMRDFIGNLKGLTRHEIIHVLGLASGIILENPAASQPTRHDTFLFDSAGRPFVNPDGTVSSLANLSDPNAYFDGSGNAPNYRISRQHDFSHLDGILFPYRTSINNDDRAYFRTIGYGPPAAKLLNISTRMRVLSGDAVLIAGFIVTGPEPKRVLIRAIGPSLETRGVAGALQDPALELFDSGNNLLQANNNWFDSQAEELRETGLQPEFSSEAAIVRTLAPGAYTAVVRGNGNTSGVGVVELYDLSDTADAQLANISTRGFVETGDKVMIGGFIIGHPTSRDAELLVRALGPSLTASGVPDALQDPTLSVHDADGNLVRANDNWRETQQAELTASGFAPSSDAESAMLISRPPGNTTAIVRGNNGTIGNALVEVYRLN